MQSMDHKRLWQETSRKLKQILTPENYERWFAALEPISFDDNVLTLGCANNLKQIWLEDNYASLLSEIIEKKFDIRLSAFLRFKRNSCKPAKPERQVVVLVRSFQRFIVVRLSKF